MRSFLNLLARFLAAACAILFVGTAVLALLLFNLERRAFDPQTYKRALNGQNIYERLPAVLAQALSSPASYDPCSTNLIACGAENRTPENRACMETAMGQDQYQALAESRLAPTPEETQQAEACNEQFPSPQPDQTGQGGPPVFLRNLKAADWEVILRAILPPDETKAMAEQGFDSLFAYLNGETDSAKLSLAGLKQNLNSPAGVQAVNELMRRQQPCTLQEVAELTAASLLGEGDLKWCRPPETVIAILQPLIEFQLHLAAATIPEAVTLIKAPPPEAALSGVVDQRERLQRVRLLMRLSPLLPLALLLLITILVVRTQLDWQRWWGWPLLLAGILSTLLGFLSVPIFRFVYTRALAPRLPVYVPADLAQTGRDLLGGLIQQMLRPVAWEGLALGLIGLAMLLAADRQAKRNRLAASEADTKLL